MWGVVSSLCEWMGLTTVAQIATVFNNDRFFLSNLMNAPINGLIIATHFMRGHLQSLGSMLDKLWDRRNIVQEIRIRKVQWLIAPCTALAVNCISRIGSEIVSPSRRQLLHTSSREFHDIAKRVSTAIQQQSTST